MAFLRLSFYFIFISTAFSVDKNPSIFNNYLDVTPTHYDVKLIPIFKKDGDTHSIIYQYRPFYYIKNEYVTEHQENSDFLFYGELNATIDVFRRTEKISLSSSNSILILYNKLMEYDDVSKSHLIYSMEYNRNTKICNFYLQNELQEGSYILNLKFLNAINNMENNIISLTVPTKKSGEKTWSSGTHFQVIGARQLFPCWDELTVKTTFNIAVKHHRKYKVFSNMPIQKEEICKPEIVNIWGIGLTEINDRQWTYFYSTPKIPTYIVTIAFSPMSFHYLFDTDRIIIWHRSEFQSLKFTQSLANEIMILFESKWKILKNLKVQFVAIPGLPYNYENWGLVLNRETNIIYDKDLDFVSDKIEVERLIGHQVAYQWFSNSINPVWSSSLWLIDGLSTLFGIKAIDDITVSRKFKVMNLFIVQAQYESLRLDTYSLMKPLIEETNSFDINNLAFSSRYIKAFLILHMMQYLITNTVFEDSIQYFNKHVVNSMNHDDFWIRMEHAMVKTYPPNIKQDPLSNFFLTTILNGWIKYMGYPILEITRDYFKNRLTITIKNYYMLKEYDLWIPVTYTTQNDLNFGNLMLPLHDERLKLMHSKNQSQEIFNIRDDGWVMFNLQQTGYYRVNYDRENWQRISKYLNSNEYEKVHVLNRAKLIDDAFYFMIRIDQIDSSIFWNLTSYLAQETNYIVWYPMIKAFEHMSSIFPLPDEKVKTIKDKINKMLAGLLSKITYNDYDEENELTICLRQEAIKWACILGESNCQTIAYETLKEHIERLKTKLLPWREEWTYCKGLMSADSQIWHKVKHTALTQNNNRFLEFLACAKNNIDEYLKLLTPQDNGTYIGIQPKNSINSLLFIIAKHARNDTVLDNILTNFEKLKPRGVNRLTIFTVIVNHVYSEKQLDKIRNSMRDIIEEQAMECIIKSIQKNESLSGLPYNRTSIQSDEKYKNLLIKSTTIVEKWMEYAERKLKTRLSEIKKLISYLQIF
ncbi:aminopeptidase N-like [Anoplolepis gracilipes]|uniref:aminopeptidase N-like n=1 Tax=Anoplolepis gracilipes TaxID=354296 RepID=UPI003B9F78CE